MAAALVLTVSFLAMLAVSDAAWCVCRTDVSSSAQQKTLDYACGAGANCNPILQSGACFNPNTVLAHCSYAANSYFQIKGQAQGSCDFSGTAVTTQTDPSGNGCSYPATPSAAASGGGSTQNPGSSSSSAGSSLTPTSNANGGVLGGGGGLGPSSFDDSSALPCLLPSNHAMLMMAFLISIFCMRI